jgi:hypothetical protein
VDIGRNILLWLPKGFCTKLVVAQSMDRSNAGPTVMNLGKLHCKSFQVRDLEHGNLSENYSVRKLRARTLTLVLSSRVGMLVRDVRPW